MCFSATADVVSGLAVTAVGVDALRQVDRPGERALGMLPVLLGAHLLVEAVAALTWLESSALTSLWCAWAAVTSVAIAAHLRRTHQPDEVGVQLT